MNLPGPGEKHESRPYPRPGPGSRSIPEHVPNFIELSSGLNLRLPLFIDFLQDFSKDMLGLLHLIYFTSFRVIITSLLNKPLDPDIVCTSFKLPLYIPIRHRCTTTFGCIRGDMFFFKRGPLKNTKAGSLGPKFLRKS